MYNLSNLPITDTNFPLLASELSLRCSDTKLAETTDSVVFLGRIMSEIDMR